MSLPFYQFSVSVCETAAEGLSAATEQSFDAILLDVNLPDSDGFRLCRELRMRDPDMPILMLTAKTDEASAVTGIECGADDYIRKPYGIHELIARIRRLLEKRDRDIIGFGSLRIDKAGYQAWAGDHKLDLSKREFDILALLARKGSGVVTRDEVLATIDSDAHIYDRTIDSHLSHLRKKLRRAGATERISPVYGVGYRLMAEAQ